MTLQEPHSIRHPTGVRISLGLLAVYLAANGTWMLWAPTSWYAGVPGVADTGPMNSHVIRDIGITYLALAVACVLALRRPWATATAATIATFWLAGHACLHLVEALLGHSAGPWYTEVFGIYVPAALAAWVAWRSWQQERSMSS